jgi:hypothetical protein
VKDGVYILPVPINLKVMDRIQTAIAKIDQALLQNVWHEVGYCLEVLRATDGAHFELAFLYAFNFCVAVTFLLVNFM